MCILLNAKIIKFGNFGFILVLIRKGKRTTREMILPLARIGNRWRKKKILRMCLDSRSGEKK